MYLLTTWLVEVGVAIDIWTHTSLYQVFFDNHITLPGTWWLSHAVDTESLRLSLHLSLSYMSVCFGQPEIHMIRTSLYTYVIKSLVLKHVINLFDCFKKKNFFPFFFTFHFHLKPVQLPQYAGRFDKTC